MTQSETVLLSLIKKSLFGINEFIPADTDWSAVLKEAELQAVVGIVAAALPKECPSEIKIQWQAKEYQRIAQQIRYWNAQDQLDQLLTEHEIPYVILKGAAAAMYYPNPSRRAMGDIDFLVPPDRFDMAKQLLIENGYSPNNEPNDRHIGFSKNQVFFELHHRFSYPDLYLEDSVLSGLSHAEQKNVDGHLFSTLPVAENGLVFLAHLWEHLHSGVGMRQAIDWMMFVHTHLSDDLWNKTFSNLARDHGLEKLAITTAQMCHKYFGLPCSYSWFADADETICDDLFSQILQYVNFGRKPNTDAADLKTITALSDIHRFGLFRQLQQRGEANWKACHKHTWLKPFAWLYQLFRYPILWLTMAKKHKLSSLMQHDNETNNLLRRLK